MSGTYCTCYPNGRQGCAIHAPGLAAEKISDSNADVVREIRGLRSDLAEVVHSLRTLTLFLTGRELADLAGEPPAAPTERTPPKEGT